MRSIKITNGIILKQTHIMQKQEKKPVGRPKSDDPKKEHIRIRVTEQEKKMLKGTKMSSLINTGLKIVMPTLGVYIEDENRWVDYKESGTDANLVVYNSICLAIDIIKSRREKILNQHKESGAFQSDKTPFFPDGYFTSAENELFSMLCRQKIELETHETFYDLRVKDRK